jgi:hypothetical protein
MRLLCGYATARIFYATITVVQKIEHTAIVSQAYASALWTLRTLLPNPILGPGFAPGLFLGWHATERVYIGRLFL